MQKEEQAKNRKAREAEKQRCKATDQQQGQRKRIDGGLKVKKGGEKYRGQKKKKSSLRAAMGYLFIISIYKTVPSAKPSGYTQNNK